MKSLFSLCVVLAALCLPLHADVVIVQKVDGAPMMNGDMTIKIKGNQMRNDIGTMMSTIMNFDTGDTLMLMHTQKMVMKMSGDQIKSSMEKAQAASADKSPAPKVEFVPTGKSETIDGHKADEYTLTAKSTTTHYWFAKDYPHSDVYRDAMKKMMTSTFSKMAQGTASMPDSFPDGVPIRTETEAMGNKITTTLVSLTEENVDPSVFTAPADYKEMKMPAMPQAPAAQ
jgi:hypothetical protein